MTRAAVLSHRDRKRPPQYEMWVGIKSQMGGHGVVGSDFSRYINLSLLFRSSNIYSSLSLKFPLNSRP